MRSHYNTQVIGQGSAAEVFGRIYGIGMWGKKDSSGAGGSDVESRPLLDLLRFWVPITSWESILDLGCGDGRVTAQLPFARIIGVDVHRPHVERLRDQHPEIRWVVGDIDRNRDKLPSADVCLVKDVLHHWPSSLIRDWLTWARGSGKWQWIFFVSDVHQKSDGQDCILGGYRAVHPDLAPLKEFGLIKVTEYLHKAVLAMDCRQQTQIGESI